jgi:hypothetical protein
MSVTFRVWCPTGGNKIRGDLEFDLEDFFGAAGWVSGGGGWPGGFDVDVETAEDAGWEARIPQLKRFLWESGYPEGIYIEVFPPDWEEGQAVPKFLVFGE